MCSCFSGWVWQRHILDDWNALTTYKSVLRQLHLTVYSREVVRYWRVHTEVTSATIWKSYSHCWNPGIEGSGIYGQGLELHLFITSVTNNCLTHQVTKTNLKGQYTTLGKVIPKECLCTHYQVTNTSFLKQTGKCHPRWVWLNSIWFKVMESMILRNDGKPPSPERPCSFSTYNSAHFYDIICNVF